MTISACCWFAENAVQYGGGTAPTTFSATVEGGFVLRWSASTHIDGEDPRRDRNPACHPEGRTPAGSNDFIVPLHFLVLPRGRVLLHFNSVGIKRTSITVFFFFLPSCFDECSLTLCSLCLFPF
jgi:hypothetical protein